MKPFVNGYLIACGSVEVDDDVAQGDTRELA